MTDDSSLHLALRFGVPTDDSFSDSQQLALNFFDSDNITFPVSHFPREGGESDDFSLSINTPVPAGHISPQKAQGSAVARLETHGDVFTQLNEHSHRLRNVATAVIAANRLSSSAKRTREMHCRTPSASSSVQFEPGSFAADLQSPGRVFALLGHPGQGFPGQESPGRVYARLESTGDVMANLEDDGKILASIQSTGEVYARLESTGDVIARREDTGKWKFNPAWLTWGGGELMEAPTHQMDASDYVEGPSLSSSYCSDQSVCGTPQSTWSSAHSSPRPITRFLSSRLQSELDPHPNPPPLADIAPPAPPAIPAQPPARPLKRSASDAKAPALAAVVAAAAINTARVTSGAGTAVMAARTATPPTSGTGLAANRTVTPPVSGTGWAFARTVTPPSSGGGVPMAALMAPSSRGGGGVGLPVTRGHKGLAYDIDQVSDDRVKARLVKNRQSAERSRQKRLAQEEQMRVLAQEREAQNQALARENEALKEKVRRLEEELQRVLDHAMRPAVPLRFVRD